MAVTPKAGKKSKIVVLAVPPDRLAQLLSEARSRSDKPTPSSTTIQEGSEEKSSEDNDTPVPLTEGQEKEAAAAAAPETKKKRAPPNPNARKRAPPAIDPDAPPRERARPGPKKKARTDAPADRTNGQESKPSITVTAPAHKLGPKANTGAINDRIRALDRSGKPCRRWNKGGLQLKSFTGSIWNMPTWKGSDRPKLDANGEVQSDSSSDAKPVDVDVSGVASEQSGSGSAVDVGETTIMTGMESSPAPAIAV